MSSDNIILVIRDEPTFWAWQDANLDGWFVSLNKDERWLHRAACYHYPPGNMRSALRLPKYVSSSREDLTEIARPTDECDCLSKAARWSSRRVSRGAGADPLAGYLLAGRLSEDQARKAVAVAMGKWTDEAYQNADKLIMRFEPKEDTWHWLEPSGGRANAMGTIGDVVNQSADMVAVTVDSDPSDDEHVDAVEFVTRQELEAQR